MAKCHRNDVGSIVLDHRYSAKNATTGVHFRLWNSRSASSFRRIIIDAVSCSGTSRYRSHRRSHDAGELNSTASSASGSQREKRQVREKSEKLSDLLSTTESETEGEAKKKEDALVELKRVVKELREDDSTKRQMAAAKVRSLAKEDSEARGTLATLGAIPPLVGMLDSEDVHSQIVSLYALLNLGIGSDANKAAIVKIGAVHKMLKLIESLDATDSSVSEAIVANFLGLSALDSNKPIIGSSGAIPFLVKTLKKLDYNDDNKNSFQVKQDALRALYNLSLFQTNVSLVLETDLVSFLVNAVGEMEVSERVLSILSNLVSTPEGRKCISGVRDAIPILVDVLNWTDSPECQEKASYILMVMAHKAYGDRQAMIEAGIGSSLLELTLVGSTLAQKRASRILECLRVDKGKQVSASATVSAPICGGGGKGYLVEDEDVMMSEEKRAVKQLVQQSLQNNMLKIVKRANLRQDFVPSQHFASLTSSSTSKSLPF
ncbi:U-box domain-containing protein 12-like isoform X2 [Abrus precatorius]|uniref:U-box domain-containing protein 12-like isoform X2 n=1 Tax=Abrus precatorius TaxID=3816 RepID=A0A8B8LNP7_ABRPR|nr:U-box domain-containing protein 12-like isoform X2 [Abrus precatorius]